jgi:hypothetical protein
MSAPLTCCSPLTSIVTLKVFPTRSLMGLGERLKLTVEFGLFANGPAFPAFSPANILETRLSMFSGRSEAMTVSGEPGRDEDEIDSGVPPPSPVFSGGAPAVPRPPVLLAG